MPQCKLPLANSRRKAFIQTSQAVNTQLPHHAQGQSRQARVEARDCSRATAPPSVRSEKTTQ